MCRVHFDSTTNKVNLLRLDKESMNSLPTIVYDGLDDLPIDIQEKVALLDVVAMDTYGKTIDKVGYKVAPDVYWVLT